MQVYIPEEEADEKAAVTVLVVCTMAMIAIIFALWVVFTYASRMPIAQAGEIRAKSEMTKAEIKVLNVMPAKLEVRNGVRHIAGR